MSVKINATPAPLTSYFSPGALAWLAIIVFTLLLLSVREAVPWLIVFPDAWESPIVLILNNIMDWCVLYTGAFFRSVSAALDVPMTAVRELLNWLPWSVSLFLLVVIAYASCGWKMVIFTVLTASYMMGVGLWTESMNSLALVLVSVPIAIIIGFACGTLGFYYPRTERPLMLLLDVLQTVPAFAYLLLILYLFGFGVVVGLIASVLYAFPPMARNTLIGLRGVSSEVTESGLMSGATASQLFFFVRMPSAMRQILLGVNQTTMAAFCMVIIASIIGGSADIGWEVLSAMRKARFGESLVAGIVITLMAILMDRITVGFANKGSYDSLTATRSLMHRHRYFLTALIGSLVLYAIANLQPAFHTYPKGWEYNPSGPINDATDFIIVEYADVITLIKTWAFFFLMLPLKIGLEQTISPYSWGFEFTLQLKLVYAACAAIITGLCWTKLSSKCGTAIGLLTITLFFGITKLPWPAMFAIFTFLGWQLGGFRLALAVLAGLIYLLFSGIWEETTLSLYLCGLAILISFTLGATIGILAAEFKPVSMFVRPINDTLQTIPLFVLLIPFVMIFKIGEFTALLAIIAYAIVPAMRYTEHGIRQVSHEVIEAGECMGASRWQMLWRVKIPLAMPVMMVGLNQTIMFGISMLTIAALVGTSGLGQQVYIGLGDGNFGLGMTAGIGMAIIAMLADRLIQAWSKKRQSELGLKSD
jgi:glycine betaine/proline transport system permease protein